MYDHLVENDRNLDVKKGFVGGEMVNVLRDTSCESAAVKKKIVREEHYLGREIVMITIDGDTKVVPVAKVLVDTPYYVGEVEAMKSLICDLVIGNITGVRYKPDPKWEKTVETSAIAAVTTRAQHKKAYQPTQALNVPKPSYENEVDIEKLKTTQTDDTSLKKVWDLAAKEECSDIKG